MNYSRRAFYHNRKDVPHDEIPVFSKNYAATASHHRCVSDLSLRTSFLPAIFIILCTDAVFLSQNEFSSRQTSNPKIHLSLWICTAFVGYFIFYPTVFMRKDFGTTRIVC